MTEEYIEKIKKRVSRIMFENKKLFPIVSDVFIAAEHYKVPEKDLEFYVRQTIESRIGLSYIIRNKVNGIDEIRWTINNDIRKQLEIALIKSIIIEYTNPILLERKDIQEFNLIEI